MSMYYAGELTINTNQKRIITAYLEMIDEDPMLGENPDKQKYVLTILDAFEQDPLKAAEAYNAAIKNAEQAMLDCYEKTIGQAPFPEKKNFYQKFETVAEGKKKWAQLQEESQQHWNDVIEKEFWNVVESYHSQEWDKSVSIQ